LLTESGIIKNQSPDVCIAIMLYDQKKLARDYGTGMNVDKYSNFPRNFLESVFSYPDRRPIGPSEIGHQGMVAELQGAENINHPQARQIGNVGKATN